VCLLVSSTRGFSCTALYYFCILCLRFESAHAEDAADVPQSCPCISVPDFEDNTLTEVVADMALSYDRISVLEV
jgi:hypothetical protein